MEVLKMANSISRVSLIRRTLTSILPLSSVFLLPMLHTPTRKFIVSASNEPLTNRWKPTCLYYTQHKCTLVLFIPIISYLLANLSKLLILFPCIQLLKLYLFIIRFVFIVCILYK